VMSSLSLPCLFVFSDLAERLETLAGINPLGAGCKRR
jgi:hypothetical protein